MTIPPEAIEAAARAMEPLVSKNMDEAMRNAWLEDLATTALTAAAPHMGQWMPIETDDGPQRVRVPAKLTCTGCRHLKTEWWKDYLDNDETDSGTSARCTAVPDEHGGRSITAYWSNNSAPPAWCPRTGDTP